MDNLDNKSLDLDDDFLPMEPETPSKNESNDNNSQKEDSSNDSILPSNDDINIFNDENNIFEDAKEEVKDELPSNDLSKQVLPSNEIKIENKGSHIKNLVNYAKVLPVIAFLFVSGLGIYIFINNVKADIIDLIKIEENAKVGYINENGKVIVKPKFLYGSDFYKGYAIVKNYNNLYGIIDGKGNNEISFGNIFSANLYSNKYVVSKFTNDGLKMGLLDSNLKEITRFKYDNLSYIKDGIFMYTDNNNMGLMNSDGKEIYSYKVDEVDDRNISVEVSSIKNSDIPNTYAKIKINSSSTIINIKTGKEVYKYTLDDIRVLDNNVFYIKNDEGNNKYLIINDDKVIYQTDLYKRVRVDDIDSYIAIGIKDDASIDYINLLNKEKINQDGNIKYTYSDGVVLQEMYNFQTGKNEYSVITPKKNIGTFSDIKLVDNEFVNGYAKIYTTNNKYNYINKKGNVLSNVEYDTAQDFNESGFSIVCKNDLCGVIDSNGKEIIDLKYDKIKLLDDDFFNNINKKTSEQLFIFKENDKYGIINSKNKVVIKPIYDEFKMVTTKYPIIKANYKGDNVLINLYNYKDLSIDVSDDVQIYDNYILSSNEYYNYNGELIYTIGG